MKRRRLLAVGLAIVPFGFAAACAFPDVTFAPGADDDAGAEGGTTDPDAGDAAFESSIPDDVDPDGHLADAATADKDATTAIDAAGCTSCDCDGDGFQRLDLDAGCDGGPGPVPDCDDTIAAIKPGQGFMLNATWPSTQHTKEFDWDCSGTVTRQYPYDGTCAALSACSNGFQGNPPCGGTAAYLTCKQPLPILGATCSTDKTEPYGDRIQGCR